MIVQHEKPIASKCEENPNNQSQNNTLNTSGMEMIETNKNDIELNMFLEMTHNNVCRQIDSFHNAVLILSFQQRTRSKVSDMAANIFRLLWNTDILFMLMPFLIWFVRGISGLILLFIMNLDEIVNGFIKWMTQKPRPFWVVTNLKNIDKTWRSDYSFPSCHAQQSCATLCAVIILYTDVIPFYIDFILIIIMICTGISRIYLGVHGIECVVTGWIIGTLFSISMCSVLPLLFEWFATLSIPYGIFLAFFGAMTPYFIFYCIIKLFPSPNQKTVTEWTKIAINNTFCDINEEEIEVNKYQLNGRDFGHYTFSIWSFVGGSIGSIIQLSNNEIVPGFLTNVCNISKQNINILLYTVLIGYSGLIVIFPFIFIVPSKLKHRNREITAHCIKIFASFIAGFWVIFGCPYISYLSLGPC